MIVRGQVVIQAELDCAGDEAVTGGRLPSGRDTT
jgi:hypothetical protein